jgi:hypothetical protein
MKKTPKPKSPTEAENQEYLDKIVQAAKDAKKSTKQAVQIKHLGTPHN